MRLSKTSWIPSPSFIGPPKTSITGPSDFKGALKALENFISDYPGTPFKEQALYYRLDSAYKLAINSIDSKKQERLAYAKTTHSSLMKFNSASEYKEKADKMLAEIEKELQQFSK